MVDIISQTTKKIVKMDRIFAPNKVKKFFNILRRLDRSCQDHYLGWDKLNPDKKPCQQEVFIARTVAKWFYGKRYKIIDEVGTGFFKSNDKYGSRYDSDEIKIKQYSYISLARPTYVLGYGQQVSVNFSRASRIGMNNMTIGHNQALKLRGEEITQERYNAIKSMFNYDGPSFCKKCDEFEYQDNLCKSCFSREKEIEEMLSKLK